jgi:hypothetical protein
MNCRHHPVIVIGMHRSGTSMLLRMLQALGLFVGEIGDNDEARFFFRIDQWLLSQSGASWDNPEPIRYLLQNSKVRPMIADYMARYLLDSPRVISFLGWKRFLQHRTVARLPMPWGWKCPLSTYTLPLWLDIFPSAKVVHIYRHGVDVASSLRERARRNLKRTTRQDLYYQARFLHWFRPKTGGFMGGMRCATLEGGFSLWEEYLAEAHRHMQALGERATEVRYEDLLCEPVKILEHLAGFCGLSTRRENLDGAIAQMKKDRAYAHRASGDLESFALRVADRLSAWKYYEDQPPTTGRRVPSPRNDSLMNDNQQELPVFGVHLGNGSHE